jgi:hypothetical protein
MTKLNLKYKGADNGNCCVYYTSNRKLYCWQKVRKGEFELLICSKDGEPDCPVRQDIPITTEPVQGNEPIEKELTAFLKAV